MEEGALSPALHRLEVRGLLKAEWGTSDNNRRAKYDKLTLLGRTRAGARTRPLDSRRRPGHAGDEHGVNAFFRRVLAIVRRNRIVSTLLSGVTAADASSLVAVAILASVALLASPPCGPRD